MDEIGRNELLELLSMEESPLNARDMFLVPLLTILSWGLRGLEPEQMIASICFTIGVVLMSMTLVGCCGRFRKLGLWVFVVLVVCGVLSLEHLKVPAVDQSPELYGSLPIRDQSDFPIVEGIHAPLVLDGIYFKDRLGRVLMLRGVNLGGDTKVPTKPDGATWNKDGFYDYTKASFVGRPFPLAEADEHLGRLSAWGFTFLRFLITWEAVEGKGPGIYDTEYLEYLQAVIRKCAEYGISVFIDPHQDVWSRFTGGDGAPGWTLEKVGFDLKSLYESGATIVHQEHGDPFPQMVWPTNYNRLATATMFTLFFSGNQYAPNCKIDGETCQNYLQGHYINAIKEVAKYLKDEPNVLGYDSLNEPSNGYAGLKDLNDPLFPAPMGWFMTGFQGMKLGAGFPVKVPFFSSPIIFTRLQTLNPKGILAWKSIEHDVWRNEGVWEFDPETKEPTLLRPQHFALNGRGEPVNFMKDFMAPFFTKFKKEIQSVHHLAVTFAEPFIDPNSPVHDTAPDNINGSHVAWAPHYYDAMSLLFKKARPWVSLDIQIELPVFSSTVALNAIAKNLAHVKEMGLTLGGLPQGGPVVVGEIGIPFDMSRDDEGMGAAYKSGDFAEQIHALDRTMKALERNLLCFTLWNYAAGNNNKRGDLWNDEDLSLFSRDQQKQPYKQNLHSGGRGLIAAVRPYPMKICGNPKHISFDPLQPDRPFRFEFISTFNSPDPETAPTIIFVPTFQYPNGINCTVSDGTFEYDRKNQHILYKHDPTKTNHIITITQK